MSTIAVDDQLHRALRFYEAPVGKKVIMALTGLVLFGYIVGHLLGNLQIYLGRERLNHYAATLHATPTLLWGTRAVLLISVALHILAAAQLTALRQEARPIGYYKKDNPHSSYASRTMIWSGIIIAAFVIYHLLHLTFGLVEPGYQSEDVYFNIVSGFRHVPVSAAYTIAILLLGMHLYHGLWSMFQSLGVSHPRYTPVLKRLAAWVTVLIVAGYISIPVAVMTQLVGSNI